MSINQRARAHQAEDLSSLRPASGTRLPLLLHTVEENLRLIDTLIVAPSFARHALAVGDERRMEPAQ